MSKEGLKYAMAKELLAKVIKDNKEKPYPKNPSKINDISKQFEAETIYIGTRTKGSKALVRIYDKKKEQKK